MFLLQSIQSWQRVFVIASLIHFAGVTFYAIFASGEKQPWADPPDEEEPTTGSAAWPPQTRAPADGSGYNQYNQEKTPEEFTRKMMTYGSTVEAPGTAPVYNTKEEFVQEQGRDPYLNGDMKDKNM